MVSDQDIAQALDSLLRETNPITTTLTGVVQQLESKLGLALTHKLDFIRNQIHLLLRSPPPQPPHFHHYQPTPKDHSFLQQNPNFHANLPPNFTLHQHADGLGFLSQKPPPVTKTESFVTDADTSSAAITASQLPPNFTLRQHADELGFLSQKPPPVTKTESFVTDADTSSAAINASQLPPNFALHQPADELGFRSQKPPPVTKTESFVTDADTSAAAESPKTSSQTGKKRRGGPGGLNKICEVSPELQAIVGHPALPRTEIVKQLWAYIRKHNLQDPSNKRKIICNDELRLVFETDCTDMFKMNKLLSKHIISLEPPKPVRQKSKKAKVEVEPVTQSAESGPVVVISEALAIFFGTGGREMLQSEVLRRVWEYVKVNQLEDPINAMVILCDSKLQELFGCASISAVGISEMLARHHLFQR